MHLRFILRLHKTRLYKTRLYKNLLIHPTTPIPIPNITQPPYPPYPPTHRNIIRQPNLIILRTPPLSPINTPTLPRPTHRRRIGFPPRTQTSKNGLVDLPGEGC